MRRGMRRGKIYPFLLLLSLYNRVQLDASPTQPQRIENDASRHASRLCVEVKRYYVGGSYSSLLTTISFVAADGEP